MVCAKISFILNLSWLWFVFLFFPLLCSDSVFPGPGAWLLLPHPSPTLRDIIHVNQLSIKSWSQLHHLIQSRWRDVFSLWVPFQCAFTESDLSFCCSWFRLPPADRVTPFIGAAAVFVLSSTHSLVSWDLLVGCSFVKILFSVRVCHSWSKETD